MTARSSSAEAGRGGNVDQTTVDSFGDEWARFDQSGVGAAELGRIFEQYFLVFPWDKLPLNAEGFDMGCGSGRWANLVAPRVGRLNCIDPSLEALDVARRRLAGHDNVRFFHAGANDTCLAPGSQDFGYSLGVIHHIPDTAGALASCVDMLKPGAPLLLYIYYRFDHRPWWFRAIWRLSEVGRAGICRLPARLKTAVTDAIAYAVYWPLARLSRVAEMLGANASAIPLYAYRDASLYTMRTDSRDRFGTPLERRFTREEIWAMMQEAGLADIVISSEPPYWCAVGCRRD